MFFVDRNSDIEKKIPSSQNFSWILLNCLIFRYSHQDNKSKNISSLEQISVTINGLASANENIGKVGEINSIGIRFNPLSIAIAIGTAYYTNRRTAHEKISPNSNHKSRQLTFSNMHRQRVRLRQEWLEIFASEYLPRIDSPGNINHTKRPNAFATFEITKPNIPFVCPSVCGPMPAKRSIAKRGRRARERHVGYGKCVNTSPPRSRPYTRERSDRQRRMPGRFSPIADRGIDYPIWIYGTLTRHTQAHTHAYTDEKMTRSRGGAIMPLANGMLCR